MLQRSRGPHAVNPPVNSRPRRGVAQLARRLRPRRPEPPPPAAPALPTIGRWFPRALLPVIALLLLVVLAIPFTKAHLQAITVLDLVANKPVPAPLRNLSVEPITTRELAIPSSAGTPIRARLYAPTAHPDAPALVVLHGVHYLGMNEPRLIAFASAMASCGLRVLTPELPDIKDYHVGASSVATIGDAVTWMTRNNGDNSVGLMGLSFSGGLSLLAAADPVYRPSITVRRRDRIAGRNVAGRRVLPHRRGRAPQRHGRSSCRPMSTALWCSSTSTWRTSSRAAISRRCAPCCARTCTKTSR